MLSASLRRVKPEFVVAAVVAVLLTGQLMYPHMVGIADNGDWERLMFSFGLSVPANVAWGQHYDNYVVRYLAMAAPLNAYVYPSSAIPFIVAAVAINKMLHPGLFDIETLGYLYIIVYALAAFLIVRNLRLLLRSALVVWAVAIAGIVVFCDLAYTAYFNSVYSEPEELVFLMLFVGAALWILAERRPKYLPMIIASVAALGFAISKTQTLPLLIAFIPIYGAFALRHRALNWRLIAIACFLLVCIGSGLVYVKSPKNLSNIDLYNSVFAGILANDSAQSAGADLSALGVSPEWAYLRGNAYFSTASLAVQNKPAFVSDFYGHVTRSKVIRFYISHPSKLLYALDKSSKASNNMRPSYLGNYSTDFGYPPLAQSHRFTFWSWFKSTFFPSGFVLLALLYALFFAGVLWTLIRARGPVGRGLPLLFASIGLMAVLQFPIPILGEGDNELIKHLYIYDALGDLCMLITFGWLLQTLITRPAPSWQQETEVRLPALFPRADATGPAGSALGMTQYGRWLFGGGFRWLYRRWTRIAVRVFPEGSRSAAIATRLRVPLPDRLNMSWITPQLAVGGRVRPKDIPLLAASGVTVVVDTRSEEQDDEAALGAARIGLLHLPTPDTHPVSLEQLEYGGRWIRERIEAGERVLVHCEHGVGRSVMMAAASLMVAGSSTHEALTLIERRRWQAAPNRRQVKRLREFEAALAARYAPMSVTAAGWETSR